jgi:hypothetical protein
MQYIIIALIVLAGCTSGEAIAAGGQTILSCSGTLTNLLLSGERGGMDGDPIYETLTVVIDLDKATVTSEPFLSVPIIEATDTRIIFGDKWSQDGATSGSMDRVTGELSLSVRIGKPDTGCRSLA